MLQFIIRRRVLKFVEDNDEQNYIRRSTYGKCVDYLTVETKIILNN